MTGMTSHDDVDGAGDGDGSGDVALPCHVFACCGPAIPRRFRRGARFHGPSRRKFVIAATRCSKSVCEKTSCRYDKLPSSPSQEIPPPPSPASVPATLSYPSSSSSLQVSQPPSLPSPPLVPSVSLLSPRWWLASTMHRWVKPYLNATRGPTRAS